MKRIIALLLCAVCAGAVICGCSDSSSKGTDESVSQAAEVQLSKVYDDIKTQVTLSEMSELDKVAKLDRYYGIAEEDVADFAGGVNNSGVVQEEIVLIKAANEDSAKKIKDALDKRYSSKLNENKNYNPEQAEMIEKCKVEQNGLYVTMIISENADKITEIFNSAIK